MKIDKVLASASGGEQMPPIGFDPVTPLHIHQKRRPNHIQQYKSVKELVAKIQGTSRFPIDLMRIGTTSATKAPDLLASIPIKYLQFAEDVRPPYIGTFTKILEPRAHSNLCRNPFLRTLPTVNYDYDSEAEWEDPGEGEDLESEGDEEEEDEDADDIEEFLDDADETGEPSSKQRLMCGDLEAISTGLCWENRGAQNQAGDKAGLDLKDFRIQILPGEHIHRCKCRLSNTDGKKINPICPLIRTRQPTGNLKTQEYSRSSQVVVQSVILWSLPAFRFILWVG